MFGTAYYYVCAYNNSVQSNQLAANTATTMAIFSVKQGFNYIFFPQQAAALRAPYVYTRLEKIPFDSDTSDAVLSSKSILTADSIQLGSPKVGGGSGGSGSGGLYQGSWWW